MSMVLRCPDCKNPFRAPENAEGKKVRCPHCQAVIRVPVTGLSPVSTADIHLSADVNTDINSKTNSNKNPKIGSVPEVTVLESKSELTPIQSDSTPFLELIDSHNNSRKKSDTTSQNSKDAQTQHSKQHLPEELEEVFLDSPSDSKLKVPAKAVDPALRSEWDEEINQDRESDHRDGPKHEKRGQFQRKNLPEKQPSKIGYRLQDSAKNVRGHRDLDKSEQTDHSNYSESKKENWKDVARGIQAIRTSYTIVWGVLLILIPLYVLITSGDPLNLKALHGVIFSESLVTEITIFLSFIAICFWIILGFMARLSWLKSTKLLPSKSFSVLHLITYLLMIFSLGILFLLFYDSRVDQSFRRSYDRAQMGGIIILVTLFFYLITEIMHIAVLAKIAVYFQNSAWITRIACMFISILTPFFLIGLLDLIFRDDIDMANRRDPFRANNLANLNQRGNWNLQNKSELAIEITKILEIVFFLIYMVGFMGLTYFYFSLTSSMLKKLNPIKSKNRKARIADENKKEDDEEDEDEEEEVKKR